MTAKCVIVGKIQPITKQRSPVGGTSSVVRFGTKQRKRRHRTFQRSKLLAGADPFQPPIEKIQPFAATAPKLLSG